MIPDEHLVEAQRRRHARALPGQKVESKEEAAQREEVARAWRRKMQAQAKAIMGMHEMWTELSQVLPTASPGGNMTWTEHALMAKGRDDVVRLIERHARWQEEET